MTGKQEGVETLSGDAVSSTLCGIESQWFVYLNETGRSENGFCR